jgi:parallel beta-helix repeat protein
MRRAIVSLVLLASSCQGEATKNNAKPTPVEGAEAAAKPPAAPIADASGVITLAPGPDAQDQLQEALIKVKPGQVIQLEEGTFALTRGLSLTVDQVTIRGRGMQKTTLSFKGQDTGSEGLSIKANGTLLEDFGVSDSKGDAIKVTEAKGITFRRVRTDWTGEPSSKNGAYGLYPVLSEDVLIEDCYARGASDSGIYVGQSKNIIVRRNKAEENVAGIEIENSIGADVYENEATNNTGGILVFSLPGLQLKNGSSVRVFHNKVIENNHVNFATPGNIVADVPSGTGIMAMAVDQVEIFENQIVKNQTANTIVVSFLVTQRPIEDQQYDPYPEGIFIHDNSYEAGGENPNGSLGILLKSLVDTPAPDINYDGIVNEKALIAGKPPEGKGLYLANNKSQGKEATFANLHLANLQPADILMGKGKEGVSRDATAHQGTMQPLPVVTIVKNP